MLKIKWRQREPTRKIDLSDTILERLAAIRGIDDLDEYLYPSRKSLTDPYELENMEKAVQRIVQALDERQRITILMDFDNDGVCAGTMMYRYLSNFTTKLNYLVYERSEDHGLRNKKISNTDLLIVVDSGTNDVKECKTLSESGIDIVIIDHHVPSVKNKYAIIVNNQFGDYISKNLSGSGVVLKVLQALDSYFGTTYHHDFFDLAAIGIIGDVMDLSEPENRYIIDIGLKNIVNLGLKQLLSIKKFNIENLTSTNISFGIVPMINAATRMNKVRVVVKLLLSDDPVEIIELAKQCDELNNARKEKQQIAAENLVFDDSYSIIFCVENDLAGNMRGLLASQLASTYCKPAIVVKLNERTNIYEGSARGYGIENFRDFVQQTNLVVSAEGHDNAFGLRIKADKVENFIAVCNEQLNIKDSQYIEYDIELDVSEVTNTIINDIELFNRISGNGCEPAKVKIKKIIVYDKKVIGKNKDTIKLEGNGLTLIKFRTTEDYASDIVPFVTIDAIGTLGFNRWYHWGKRAMVIENQLILDDYRLT